MNRYDGQAAAWAAPLFSLLQDTPPHTKHSHKLPAMPCVLWLPDYRAYLRSLDLFKSTFTTSATPEGAMRLGDEQAVAVGQDLIDTTGVRVRVRAYHPAH